MKHTMVVAIGILVPLVTSARDLGTNILSLYLLANKTPTSVLFSEYLKLKEVKLMPTPVLVASDFKAYDRGLHTFRISAQAAKQLAKTILSINGIDNGPTVLHSGDKIYELCGPDTPFVLVASGEPIYLGMFSSPYSASSYSVPFIWAAPADTHLNINATNDVTFMIRLNTVRLDMYSVSAKQDVRSDPRILESLSKLGF
jgi:hypothetical protein